MIDIISFGYSHPDGAPDAHMTFDLRELFKDPHVSPELRQLTGMHPKVIQNVFRQPGAEAFLQGIAQAVIATIGTQNLVVAFGCVGGRHRSVVFAEALHQELAARFRQRPPSEWVTTAVEHRDIDKPVLVR